MRNLISKVSKIILGTSGVLIMGSNFLPMQKKEFRDLKIENREEKGGKWTNFKQVQIPHYEKVIFIGIDGIGRFYNKAKTPTLDKFFASGLYWTNAKAVIPTDSADNWGSIITGVFPEKHKLNHQELEAGKPYPEDSIYPSIFKIISQKYPNIKMFACVGWRPIVTGMIEKSVKVDRYSPLINESKETQDKLHRKEKQGQSDYDTLVVSRVVDYIKDSKNEKLRFLFVHLTDTDEHGHFYGFNTEQQLKQIEKADSQLGQIFQAIKEKKWEEKTLIIITTDHGGVNTTDSQGNEKGSHGGKSPEEIEVFLAISGKGIKPIEIRSEITNMDCAAIILKALGVDIPKWFDAKVPRIF